jgi:hypothetical protein
MLRFIYPELAVLSILLWSAPLFAASPSFNGFWLFVGGQSMTNSSASVASYDYANRYSGSLNPPGFEVRDDYTLKNEKAVGLASAHFLFVQTEGSFTFGLSLGATHHDTMEIISTPFDMPSPTGTADVPRNFKMTTEIRPAFDVDVAFEPTYAVANDLMLYLKLAYHQMTADVLTHTSTSGLAYPLYNEVSQSYRFEGGGGGIGLRILHSSNIVIEALLEYVMFAPVTVKGSNMISWPDEISISQTQAVSLKWNAFSLSIGYKF